MSGPKVVRIVSREEVEAACRRQFQTVQQALDQLGRKIERFAAADPERMAEIARQKAHFEDLLKRDRFDEIQKQAPAAVAFLRAESERLEREAIEQRTRAREELRRLADAARTLLAAAPPHMRIQLAEVAQQSCDHAHAHTIVDAALGALRAHPHQNDHSSDGGLAERLAQGAATGTYEGWLEGRALPEDMGRRRIDRALAELEVICGAGVLASFADRLAAFDAEGDHGRRSLLADSLVLTMGQTVAVHRDFLGTCERAQAALATGAAYPDDRSLENHRRDVEEAINRGDVETLKPIVAAFETKLKALEAEHANRARRQALLGALAELGYEVRQSLTTQLVENGRIVVRRPGSQDYGVEVLAPPVGGRVQLSLVGSASPQSGRSPQRDRDEETRWCGDLDRIRAFLRSSGGEIEVERALPVGAQPVRDVELPSLAAADEDREAVNPLRHLAR